MPPPQGLLLLLQRLPLLRLLLLGCEEALLLHPLHPRQLPILLLLGRRPALLQGRQVLLQGQLMLRLRPHHFGLGGCLSWISISRPVHGTGREGLHAGM